MIVIGESEPPHLFEVILAEEGHAWAVGIPLIGLGPPAVLGVLSYQPDAFTVDDLPFFDALGRMVGDRLLELAAEGG